MTPIGHLTRGTAALLRDLGCRGEPVLSPLPGGANNRVFRVDAGGRSFFLKHYFHHPADPRDRLGHEWAFAQFAWKSGLRALSQPLACDTDRRLALFEFVEGDRLAPFEVSPEHVLEAARFFRELNRHRAAEDAAALPGASEAAFRMADHLEGIGRRVAALSGIELKSPACETALNFVETELFPAWADVRGAIELESSSSEREAELAGVERCVSPSDFGFHNVLVRRDGPLLFHDFEYAGWDDPAKMVCDFFCQVQVPAPRESAAVFAATVLEDFDRAALPRRIGLLWPAYQVKWCCIVLNDFLPVSETRRSYAGQPPSELRRHRQLDMARSLLNRISEQGLALCD